MVKSKFEAPAGAGCVSVLNAENSGLKWLKFDLLRLKAGETWQQASGGEEWAFVWLKGRCEVSVEGREAQHWDSVGGRDDVFGGPPFVLYVSRQMTVGLKALSDAEVALAKSLCEVDMAARLLSPGDANVLSSGAGPWRRDVRLLLPPGSPVSQRLIVGETLHAPAQWSGWPPHKHDTVSAEEHPLEEFYFYRTKPMDGFGVQLLYGGPNDLREAHMVSHNDTVVFHEGYHPYVAGPGASCYYLWVLAGEKKVYKVTTDPQYSWAMTAEAMIKERGR